jgi:hypothetical protein
LIWKKNLADGEPNRFVFAKSIALDTEQNPVFFGRTTSKTGIATPGSFQDTLRHPFMGGSRGTTIKMQPPFLIKFDKDGNRTWGSYFMDTNFDTLKYGAQWHITPTDMIIDHYGNYWILLTTYYNSDGFFKVGDQWSNYTTQSQYNILVQFKNNTILWSSYIDANLKGFGIDQFSNLYLAGEGKTSSYASPGAHLENFIPSFPGYIIKTSICDSNLADVISPSDFQPEGAVCPNSSVVFSVRPGFESYNWQLPSTWVGISDSNSIEVFVNDQSGTISVSGDYQCGESGNLEVRIEVVAVDQVDFVVHGDTLSASGHENYTWYFNGQKIENADEEFVLLNKYGTYKMAATSPEGCEITAEYIYKEEVGINELTLSGVRIYPNPVTTALNVHVGQPAQYAIYDLQGRKIKHTTHNLIDVRDLGDGMYILQIQDKHGKILKSQQFVKHAK